MSAPGAFLADVKEIRRRARQHLIDMIEDNLISERVAIETYRDMLRYFGDKDRVTMRPDIAKPGLLEHLEDVRSSTDTTSPPGPSGSNSRPH
jgi:hypothetical protein